MRSRPTLPLGVSRSIGVREGQLDARGPAGRAAVPQCLIGESSSLRVFSAAQAFREKCGNQSVHAHPLLFRTGGQSSMQAARNTYDKLSAGQCTWTRHFTTQFFRGLKPGNDGVPALRNRFLRCLAIRHATWQLGVSYQPPSALILCERSDFKQIFKFFFHHSTPMSSNKELDDVDRLDRSLERHSNHQFGIRVDKHELAATSFSDRDAISPCNRFQRLNAPVARIRAHLLEKLYRLARKAE